MKRSQGTWTARNVSVPCSASGALVAVRAIDRVAGLCVVVGMTCHPPGLGSREGKCK